MITFNVRFFFFLMLHCNTGYPILKNTFPGAHFLNRGFRASVAMISFEHHRPRGVLSFLVYVIVCEPISEIGAGRCTESLKIFFQKRCSRKRKKCFSGFIMKPPSRHSNFEKILLRRILTFSVLHTNSRTGRNLSR